MDFSALSLYEQKESQVHLFTLKIEETIDGFHSDVIRLQSQKSEVLQILIYTRLKINKKNKPLYKFPAPKGVSFRKYSNLNFQVFTVRDTKIGILSH